MLTDRARALSEARRQVHVRQALGRLPDRQRDARRRAEPHPDPAARAARAGRGVGSGCARRASTRCPRTRPRTRARRPDRQPVQLRAVRRDHRQGRAPDAARGRRRARLPGDLDRGGGPQLRAARAVLWRRRCARLPSSSPSLAAARPLPRAAPRAAPAASVDGCSTCDAPALGPAAARGHVRGAHARAVAGSERMQVRFTLQCAEPGADALAARRGADGLDEWLTSRARRAALHLRQDGRRTSPRRPTYRTVVRFRWLDADGERACEPRASRRARLPPARPAARPRAARGSRSRPRRDAGRRRYVVRVRNARPHGGRRRSRVGARRAGAAALAPVDVPGSAPASAGRARSPARVRAGRRRSPRRVDAGGARRRARRGRQRARRALPAVTRRPRCGASAVGSRGDGRARARRQRRSPRRACATRYARGVPRMARRIATSASSAPPTRSAARPSARSSSVLDLAEAHHDASRRRRCATRPTRSARAELLEAARRVLRRGALDLRDRPPRLPRGAGGRAARARARDAAARARRRVGARSTRR